jgi:trans-AT polyketide synthase/acyltransferase/oxidoreductase domain-containing protein
MSAPTLALSPEGAWPAFQPDGLIDVVARFREPTAVVSDPRTGAVGAAVGGALTMLAPGAAGWPVLATLPPLYPEWLGDRGFCEAHGTRFAYMQGAMANGIASVPMVIAMGKAGFLGMFGAAGLSFGRVEASVAELKAALGDDFAWGCNLIHSPSEPELEAKVADLYIREGVKRVSAAAFMKLTPSIVRYAASGLRQDPDGTIHRSRAVFAKISRPEVAKHFLEPAPDKILDGLVASGLLSADEARIARLVPVAEDIICESDSGGHTDNRPLGALFPSVSMLRDQIVAARGYSRPVRVGAAGGLGTPEAVAAAYAMGAAFVLTGSVNQACVESGLSEEGRLMLAEAGLADVIMAPAADMFEMGVEVQVLRRGTLFGTRAKKLYEVYRAHPSLDAVPADERQKIERDMLRATFPEAWESTKAFWMGRDPREVAKAERDPKHKMALVFRAYLGQASRWAINGLSERRSDYQIWCGPAMGAFNAWTKGSFLEAPSARGVVAVARNLLEGACVVTRAGQLRGAGAPVPAAAFSFKPRPIGD